MKITDLEVLRMDAPSEQDNNWLFVRIYTDEGIHGIGEGSLQYKDAALAAELENFGKYLKGKDPFQLEHIWTSLHRRVTWTGGAVTISAIRSPCMPMAGEDCAPRTERRVTPSRPNSTRSPPAAKQSSSRALAA